MMRRYQAPATGVLNVLFIVSILVVCAGGARADVHLAVLPASVTVGQGEVFDVELTVTEAGSLFNAYDAVVGFDPEALTFIELPPAQQQGPLMVGACGNTFHDFQIAPEGDRLYIMHSLICGGVRLTGPGVVYRLRFQAGSFDATTRIRLLDGTAFYNFGEEVLPVHTEDAQVRIGAGTGVPEASLQAVLRLRAAPNPFNPQTMFTFDVPQQAFVSLVIYAVDGRRIRTLLHEPRPAGTQSVSWNGRDEFGRPVSSGVYQIRLVAAGHVAVKSVTLVR